MAEAYVLMKCSRVPWPVENLLAFEEEICVMNLGVLPLMLRYMNTQTADSPYQFTLSLVPLLRNTHEDPRRGRKQEKSMTFLLFCTKVLHSSFP